MKAVLYQYEESSVVLRPNRENKNQIALKQGIIPLPQHRKTYFTSIWPTLNQHIFYNLTRFLSISPDTNEGRAKAISARRTKDLVWNCKICTSACRCLTKFALKTSKDLRSTYLSKWENLLHIQNYCFQLLNFCCQTYFSHTRQLPWIKSWYHKKQSSVTLPVTSTVTCCCPVMLRVD